MFEGKQMKVIVGKRQQLKKILKCFDKIYMLICHVDHIDTDISQIKPIQIERLVFLDESDNSKPKNFFNHNTSFIKDSKHLTIDQ